jgi:hypothetical protein
MIFFLLIALGPEGGTQRNSVPIRKGTIRVSSPNGPIEISALGWRVQERLVHRQRNAEVQVDRPATELQLQQFSGFVVGNCGKSG